jgi:surface antigen
MTQHEQNQSSRRAFLQQTTLGVDIAQETLSVADMVLGLLAARYAEAAVEFLFGVRNQTSYSKDIDAKHNYLFSRLANGNNRELVKEMAANHTWSDEKPQEGYGIEVYPGEWFVMPEPTAGKLKTWVTP